MPRPGYLTASTFPDLMMAGKKGEAFGKTAMRHVEQLALDMLGVERTEDITSDSLDWGIENEDNASFFYQLATLYKVTAPEFRTSPDIPFVGGTMDGLVGSDGGVEFKCPKNSTKHMFHFDEHREEYKYQVQGYLWIYNLKWIDFVSYDPRCPKEHQLKIRRIEPDAGIIDALRERCTLAHTEALKLVENIKAQRGPE